MTQPEGFKVYKIGGATIEIHGYKLTTTYPDGAVSDFWPGHGNTAAQQAGADFTGYADDLMRFGLAHDLMHHYVAVCLLQQPTSRVVWASAHGLLKKYAEEDENRMWPDRMCDEEHMVNMTLRMIVMGERLDPIGHLDTLTDDLENYLEGARRILETFDLLPQDVAA